MSNKRKKSKALNVYLNGALVGKLQKKSGGNIVFQYGDEWLQDGFAISSSLPLQEDEYKGEVITRYLDNLLPDNDHIKAIIASKLGAESIRAFDLLEVIGRDCVGALSFLPEGTVNQDSSVLEYATLNDKEIARRIRGLGTYAPLGMDKDDFRISIAGAQEKTAFLYLKGRWHEPHGLTPTTHIFKTSIGALGQELDFKDSIDNEWASLFIMKKLGLPACDAQIQQFEDLRVLVVQRFDRTWQEYRGKKILLRLPQEDLCQALGISPYKKYQNEGGPGIESIAKLLSGSQNALDRFNFFKAIMIFDLLHATDGHAKNFSVFLRPEGFCLTPFYDVMSGYFLHRRERIPITKLKLAMKVGNSGHYAFSRINKRHYQETAKKCGINNDIFEKLSSELHSTFLNMTIEDRELDKNLNHKTLEIIMEGMKKRAVVIF